MMLSKMGFGVPQVRDFLAANGCVLTVRGYDYSTSTAMVPELNGIRIKRMKLGEVVNMRDLDGFILLSGFSDVRDWWQQIKRFCKGRIWLYRVQIDDSEDRIEKDAEKIEQNRLKNIFHAADREFIETHPLDRRDTDMDPSLVDLQPHKDAAHADRLQREAAATERKRERMRERAGEQQGQIIRTIKTTRTQDVLMVTGNRRLRDPALIRKQMNTLIDECHPDIAISGMAIGTDQLFAEICIEKGIPVHAYIPFRGQENRWPARVQKRYKELLQRCEEKIIVCDSASIAAFQTRNIAMVKTSTRAIAVTDGKPGGTENCIKVLKRTNTPYTIIENRTERMGLCDNCHPIRKKFKDLGIMGA